jgi:ABC-type Fe3+/spermidine/putrescine transport system ATPase subunit
VPSLAVSLSLERVCKDFGVGEQRVAAVRDVSLQVFAGELFTLLGPSGCGKTTTLRLVAGLETLSAGTIMFEGQDFSSLPPFRRNLGMVFQSYALYPHMSIFENVAYGLRVRRLPEDEIRGRVHEALELVGLSGLDARRPAQLSGGQQQRIALARALVYGPRLLLLDEPLSNLDAKLRVYMREEIRKIQQRARITTIYVTHNQEEALSISDRLAVMYAGRVAQVGAPTEVYEAPASVGVADFLGKANLLEAEVVTRQGDRIRMRLAGGAILDVARGDPDWNPSEGEAATLFIRPERVRVGRDHGRAAVQLQGAVTRLTFLGGVVRYTLDVGGVRPVLADEQRVVPGLEVGTRTALSFDLKDLRAYPGMQRPWGEAT